MTHSKLQRAKKYLISLSALFLIAIPLWLWIIAPRFELYPSDFRYSADILSLDDLFDPEKQKFMGAQLSKTKFYYEVASSKDEILIVKNAVDVRKLTGEKIFAVERLYGINSKTGQHIPGYGDRDRTGYIFAPKNFRKQEYTYWHINYNEPALLKFREEAMLQGLRVYRYGCDYHADQTENLTFLPGVGQDRGINLDINLQVWVEPVSGWLIKYEDNTTAYYYDLTTGMRLFPWNSFKNRYTNENIAEQIRIAREKKQGIVFREKVVPSLFGFMSILFMGVSFMKKEL